jgi:hypothetical protein
MFKKVLLATALVATASFATWDKFPVLENHKGQGQVGLQYLMQGDMSGMGIYGGARYTVIPNLELGTKLPYRIYTDYDGNDGPDGLGNLPIMVRYQFMPIMNAFVDVELPIGEEELADDGIGIHAGVQYSQPFGMVNFGSELGFTIHTEGDDEYTPAYVLNVGAEGDFAVNEMITPYVGADLNVKVTDSESHGVEGDDSGDMGLWIYLGGAFAINPMFTVDASFGFGLGEDYYGEDTPMVIDVHLNINF